MDRIQPDLADATVLDLDGTPRALRLLWAERPAVLVFLRHFGWLFCREQAVQVHREREGIRAHGAEVFLVGSGAPRHARAFAENLGLDVPVFTDPSLRSYAALGFQRGVARTLSPRSLGHLARAIRGGFRQGRTKGDPWQLGGVVVVRTDGTVAYRQASEEAGDHAPMEDVLAAVAERRAG